MIVYYQLPGLALVLTLMAALVLCEVQHLETVSGTSRYLLLCDANSVNGGDYSYQELSKK